MSDEFLFGAPVPVGTSAVTDDRYKSPPMKIVANLEACPIGTMARIRELEACVLEYWHAKDWAAVGAADSTAAKLLPADMKARAALKEGT